MAEEPRKSEVSQALELGRLFFRLGWRSLEFLTSVAARVLPPKRTEHAPPKSGRNEDRLMETEAQMHRREVIGTGLVAFFFVLSMIGGVGFLVAYWSGTNNTQWLGASLGAFLCGLGITSVLWARLLMTHKQAVEPRHPVASTPIAQKAAERALCDGLHDVRRRRMLAWMAAGGAGLFSGMVLSLLRGLGMSPKSLYDRIWKSGQRLVTADGKPVSLASLKPGSTVVVFPEDQIGAERAQTVLIRVKEEMLELPPERANWAPGGYVAYSRVCTHAGCPVGEFEAEQLILLCPCHQSSFNVLRAAEPTGGPAARPLPQLPLSADADGTLRAAGEFTAPPGPGFWNIA